MTQRIHYIPKQRRPQEVEEVAPTRAEAECATRRHEELQAEAIAITHEAEITIDAIDRTLGYLAIKSA